MQSEKIAKLREIIDDSRSIVFFGGAGVSTASGIPDYRSVDGLYHQKFKYPPEYMLSHTYFMKDPDGFYEFYKSKFLWTDVQPNAAHYKLAELEKAGRLSAVLTQNVDGLHQKAGSKKVFELHGSIYRNYCMKCRTAYDVEYIQHSEGVPRCTACGGIVKPDVVLYEEGLDSDVMSGAVHAIRNADTMIIGGTSLVVYPVAGLYHYFRGKHLVIINREATGADGDAELVINDDIDKVLGSITVTAL